jgi:hypothetical protein
MANNLFANPIVITSEMTQGYKASVASQIGTLFTLKIEKVYWFNPQNVGDTVDIGDPVSGETILDLRCEVANQSQIFDWTANPRILADFQVGQISSGTLYIYTR